MNQPSPAVSLALDSSREPLRLARSRGALYGLFAVSIVGAASTPFFLVQRPVAEKQGKRMMEPPHDQQAPLALAVAQLSGPESSRPPLNATPLKELPLAESRLSGPPFLASEASAQPEVEREPQATTHIQRNSTVRKPLVAASYKPGPMAAWLPEPAAYVARQAVAQTQDHALPMPAMVQPENEVMQVTSGTIEPVAVSAPVIQAEAALPSVPFADSIAFPVDTIDLAALQYGETVPGVASAPEVDKAEVIAAAAEVDKAEVITAEAEVDKAEVITAEAEVDKAEVIAAAPGADQAEVKATAADVDKAEVIAATPEADKAVVIAAAPEADKAELIAAGPEADKAELIAAGPEADKAELIAAGPEADKAEVIAAAAEVDKAEVITAEAEVDKAEVIAAAPVADMADVIAAAPEADQAGLIATSHQDNNVQAIGTVLEEDDSQIVVAAASPGQPVIADMPVLPPLPSLLVVNEPSQFSQSVPAGADEEEVVVVAAASSSLAPAPQHDLRLAQSGDVVVVSTTSSSRVGSAYLETELRGLSLAMSTRLGASNTALARAPELPKWAVMGEGKKLRLSR